MRLEISGNFQKFFIPEISKKFPRQLYYHHSGEHVTLHCGKLLLIAPASMNTIGSLAHGITEDVVTLTAAGIPPRSIPRILAPSMNAAMWSQPPTQRNLKLLEDDGWLVVPPDEGMQACQTTGPGRLPEPENLLQVISDQLN